MKILNEQVWNYKNWLFGLLSAAIIGLAANGISTLSEISNNLQAITLAVAERPTRMEVRDMVDRDGPYLKDRDFIKSELNKFKEMREEANTIRKEILNLVEANRTGTVNLSIRIERLATIIERLDTRLKRDFLPQK